MPGLPARPRGDRRPTPLDGAALALYEAIAGDCHSHSDWSDGGSPIEEMAEAAAALGRQYLALTDHSPRLTVAHGLDPERLRRQLDVVAEINERLAPFRILTGIEVDILEDGSLDQDEELLARLDVVVASVHSKLRMDAPAMTRADAARPIESPHTDILGHCTGRILVGRGGLRRRSTPRRCSRPAPAPARRSRSTRAPSASTRPTSCWHSPWRSDAGSPIDTDAHAPGQLEWMRGGCAKAAAAGVTRRHRGQHAAGRRPAGLDGRPRTGDGRRTSLRSPSWRSPSRPPSRPCWPS